MDGKPDHQPPPATDRQTSLQPAGRAPVQRFDTRTGRPIAPAGSAALDGAGPNGAGLVQPLRRSTFVRDLLLLTLHLIVYVVVVGGILFIGPDFGFGYRTFDAVFWPSFAWGTLIAAQAGTVVFQRRRLLGAVLGAMTSVLLGSWILGQLFEYQVVAIVFRSIAVAVSALSIGTSLVRRPPAILLGESVLTDAGARPVPVPTLSGHRAVIGSIPNLMLGLFALIFTCAAIVAGTFRALEVRGSGEFGQRGGNLAPVSRISASGLGTLMIQSGPHATLTVSGDANLLDNVEWSTVQGELRLVFDPGSPAPVRLRQPLVYQVTLPSLDSLTIDGRIEAVVGPGFERGSLRVVASKNTRLTASDLDLESLSVAVRDNTSVDLAGRAETVDIEAGDAAIVEGSNLASGSADVSVADITHVEIGETSTLRYRQSGSAILQCASETEIVSPSVAVDPQCVGSPVRGPASDSRELPAP